MNLKGKTAWITGASSGIGEATARAFFEAGANVILSARSREKLEALQKELDPEKKRSLVLPLDLSQGSFGDAVSQVKESFSSIHYLVNNGGISQRALAREASMETVEQIFRVNALGTIALTSAAFPIIDPSGRILTITSVTGRFGTPLRSSYSATKHALHGYFDAMRAEQSATGPGVTLIVPGFVKTNVSINALTSDGSAQGTMDPSTNAGLPPEAVARAILKAIRKGKDEVVVAGFKERFALFLKRFAPGLLKRMLAKTAVT
ncbi:MAG TPA: short-chain dehydrogenase [Leptospiraceae bacterium]|nr:short-chain dehydrogenase [Spirochaetaceae bacterium]HBS04351.1 short-chain dehydrogenase [Leptospiraceae bacterium]|tara:strand:+ start:3241 stop:4029 length:789 start_codon:yes stop_codon:yes gene_type:complete